MERNALNTLQAWYSGFPRKPLIIRGARQVGKTSLVRMFAESAKIDLVEVNLERRRELKKVFSRPDIPSILLELEGIAGRKIDFNKSILFLDEIQAVPEAIEALRYFYEEMPGLAVLAAGSLLEFALSAHRFSMPVGRIEYLHLGPMTFSEFLRVADPFCADWLDGFNFDWTPAAGDRDARTIRIPGTMHDRMIKRQREYLFTGGMPEAVAAFRGNNGFAAVSRVHDSIIDTYIDDFAKYSRQADLVLLQSIFRALPSQIGKKIVYSRFVQDEGSAKIRQSLDLLIKARLAAKVIHSHGNGIPLGAEMDDKVFKLIFLDIGLLNRMFGIPFHRVASMDESTLVNEGVLAEQFVGQHLLQNRSIRSPLFLNYWQRGGKTGNAEVDFLVQFEDLIIPVEVKAGKSGTLKSLHQFMLEKKRNLAVRMDLNQPSLQTISVQGPGGAPIVYKLLSLPLYLIEKITEGCSSVAERGLPA